MYGLATRTRNPESFIKFLRRERIDESRFQYIRRTIDNYYAKDILTGKEIYIRY